jgi:hypothetical protein
VACLRGSENELRFLIETQIIISNWALLFKLEMHLLVKAESYMVLSIHDIGDLINFIQLIHDNVVALVLNRLKILQDRRQISFVLWIGLSVSSMFNTPLIRLHDLEHG